MTSGNNLRECGIAAGAVVVAGAVALGAALWIRYGLIEVDHYAQACAEAGATGMCDLRAGIVQAFLHQRLGLVSLVASVAALLLRLAPLAWVGWVTGLAGLVLYNFDFAAVGALLSLLLLARRAAERRECQR